MTDPDQDERRTEAVPCGLLRYSSRGLEKRTLSSRPKDHVVSPGVVDEVSPEVL